MMEKNLLWGILVFLHLSICCCFYEPNSLPDIGNADFIDECVSVHNRFRSNVNPPASNMQRMVRNLYSLFIVIEKCSVEIIDAHNSLELVYNCLQVLLKSPSQHCYDMSPW